MDHLAAGLRHDPKLIGAARAVAGDLLRRYGEDAASAEPTQGWVHPGWMSERLVVRVGLLPGDTGLRKEARVAAALPRAVGYPDVIDVGEHAGHEYLVTRRLPGTSLSIAWSTLGREDRADALRQLWELAQQAHATNLDDLSGINLEGSPFYAATLDDASTVLDELAEVGLLAPSQTQTLLRQLDEYFAARPTVAAVLNHGDLVIGNAIWDGTKVSALLDFEFATVAPVELDLNELVKHAFAPADTLDDRSRPANDPLRQTVRDIVADLDLHRPVLIGYSILLESWLTRREIAQAPLDEIRSRQSTRLLVALAEQSAGYMHPLLGDPA